MLAAVVLAPLPLVGHLVTTQLVRPAAAAPGWGHVTLATLALWAIIESLIVTTLGILGRLHLPELLLVEVSLLAVGASLIVRDRGRTVLRECSRIPGRVGDVSRWPLAERWLLALICGTGTLLLAQEIWIPTQDYDSLSFQLPRVAEWYQHGTLFKPIPQFPPEIHINRYPYVWNTLYFLALAPMGHDEFILLPNLVAWTMLGVATHRLARFGGGDPAGSFLAAVLLLLAPLTVANVHTAHTDLPLAALFVSSIYFTLYAAQHRDPCSGLLAVACAGMLLGIKMSGIGYFALLAALWAWVFLASWRTRRHPGSALLAALRGHPLLGVIALGSLGLLGGSWYLRNAWETGNPLGFVQVSLFGRVLWEGSHTRATVTETSLLGNFHLTEAEHWSILAYALTESWGVPGLVFIGASLAVLGTLLRPRGGRAPLLALALLCLGSFYIYAAGPWSGKIRPTAELSSVWIGRQLRYGFPFLTLLAVLAGTQLRLRFSPLVAGGMAALATVATVDALTHSGMFLEWYPRRSTVLLAGAVAGFFAATTPAVWGVAQSRLIALLNLGRRRPGLGIAASLVALVLASLTSLSALGVRRDVRYSLHGGIARFIDEELPATARVGFWGTHKTYLLYGHALRRPLHFLALRAHPTWDAALAYVRAAPVDVVAVGPVIDQSPRWHRIHRLADDKAGLQRIHGEDVQQHVLVYRVRPRPD
jgi:Dolichyl-phosphate-mannose-protein mannosyltransferase